MGSPSSRLKTAEQFRPWVDSGLKYVLAPQDAVQTAGASFHTAGIKTHGQQDSSVRHSAAVKPNVSQSGQGSSSPFQAGTPASLASSQQSSFPPTPPQQPQRNTVQFPKPWDRFLSLVKAPEPKVVCTYLELGLDLDGHSDPRRSKVLKNTLGTHLKWPPGTAAFWPCAALVNGALQPNPTLFWKGWEIWKTPYVACFGTEALQILYPQAAAGQTVIHLEHVTLLVVPPLSELVGMLPHDQQISTELLAQVRT